MIVEVSSRLLSAPIVSREDRTDPEHRAPPAYSVGPALLVVLDTPAPADSCSSGSSSRTTGLRRSTARGTHRAGNQRCIPPTWTRAQIS